jgi:hypothetical protein
MTEKWVVRVGQKWTRKLCARSRQHELPIIDYTVAALRWKDGSSAHRNLHLTNFPTMMILKR